MRLVLLCCLALLTACHSLPPLPSWQSPGGRTHPELGVIIDLHGGRRLTPAQLVARLAGAERLLIGEQHDNSDHHALQLWLLRALAERRAPGALLLEMLEPDQQARVDELRLQVAQCRWPADLPAALAWQRGWDWQQYGRLVRYALGRPEPLLSANLDRAEIGRIYRAPPVLTGEVSAAPGVRETLLRQIAEAHCGLLPDSQLSAMLAVQQQRDRRMAERLRAAPLPAVLLAGGQHVRRDLGVPLHLRDLGAAQGLLVLQLVEVGTPVTAAQADLVWYTAAQAPIDHCAAWRRQAADKKRPGGAGSNRD